VLIQFPQMLQVLASYTRLGAEGDHLVVRGVLPPGAVHNLYLASYLAASEPPLGQDNPTAATPAVDPTRPQPRAKPPKPGTADLDRKDH